MRTEALALVADGLVDFPAVIAHDHAAFHQLTLDVHGEARQRGIGRQREVEGAFGLEVLVIEIGLVDGGAGEAILYVTRRPDGSLYWYGVLIAPARFVSSSTPVSHEAFCADTRIPALIEQLKKG